MDPQNDNATSITSAYNYYDLLAQLCFSVNSLPIEQREELYRYAVSIFPNYVRIAAERFPWLSIKPSLSIPGYASLNIALYPDLLQLTVSEDLNDWGIILGVISNIDTMLSLNPNLKTFLEGRNCKVLGDKYGGVSDSYFEFKALNCNTADRYGLLLPKLYCKWEKDSKRTIETVSLNPLSFALKNYLWVCTNNQWNITHLYCEFRKAGPDGYIQDDRQFRIVSSPLSKQAPFLAIKDPETKFYYIHYLPQNDAMLTARLKKVIDCAINKSADIVMFPEMMGSISCIQFCKEYISEYFSSSKPKLFLLPSWVHEENGVWYNTLYALDENGDCIFKYNKQYPFIYDTKDDTPDGEIDARYFEPIQADKNLFVIHVPGIGRIGLIICSDVFKDGYLDRLVKDLRITLLLYPVCTFGTDLMQRAAAPAFKYSCDIVLCNTCAAWENAFELPEKRVENNSFNPNFLTAYYPAGHFIAQNDCHWKTSKVKCTGTVCQGCLFITDLASKYKSVSYLEPQVRLEEI